MPEADGYVRTTSGSRFAAAFVIDEINYNFSGGFASSSVPFSCNNAVLSYTSAPKQLNSTRPFNGTLGPTKIKLLLDNGPTITGVLDMPLSPGSSVSGSGVWTEN